MRKAMSVIVALLGLFSYGNAIADTHAVIISPDPIEFLDTRTGQQSEIEVTLTNNRASSTFILAVNVTNDPIFSIEQSGSLNKCAGTTLNAKGSTGDTCTFKLYFNPDVVSKFTAKITVWTLTWELMDSVAVSGHGVAPTLTVEPRELSYGNTIVNTDSEPRFVSIVNTGTDVMNFVGISADPGFALVEEMTTCPTGTGTLDPSDDCEVWVIFHPTETTPYDANLTIETDATELPYAVTMTGTGVERTEVDIVLSPTSVDFGEVEVNQSSASETITVTNNGSATGTITEITTNNDDDFNVESNTCGATLEPLASCSFDIVFAPQNIETVRSQAQVFDDAADSPQEVMLRGVGIFDGTPDLSLSAQTLDFGNVTVNTYSAAQTVTITNTGTGTLTISDVTLTGDGENAYGMATTCTGSTIGAGGTCTIGAVFEPMTANTFVAGITVYSDAASGSEQTITLSGSGVESSGSGCSMLPGSAPSGGAAIVLFALSFVILHRRRFR